MRKETREFIGSFPWSIYWNPQAKKILDFLYSHSRAVGWLWPSILIVGSALFTNFRGWNPIMWRTFANDNPLTIRYESFLIKVGLLKATDYSTHHFLILTTLAGFTIALAWWMAKETQHMAWQRWGIVATYALIVVYSTHEGLWWIFYALSLDLHVNPIWFNGLGEWVCIALLLFTFAVGLYKPRFFFVSMVAFYFGWLAIGFPITESYTGNTPLFFNGPTNAIEYASWLWACATFYYFERKGLLEWTQNIRKVLNYRA